MNASKPQISEISQKAKDKIGDIIKSAREIKDLKRGKRKKRSSSLEVNFKYPEKKLITPKRTNLFPSDFPLVKKMEI